MVLIGNSVRTLPGQQRARTVAKLEDVSSVAPEPAVVKRFDCVAEAAVVGVLGWLA